MLLRFRVENHTSLLEEQELSFVAADTADAADDVASTQVPGSADMVLPVAGIFGSNASGKSNALDALAFMRNAVLASHTQWEPGSAVPRKPFLLSGEGGRRPSSFIVDIVLDDVRYEYGFSCDDDRILEEWLSSFPKRRRRLLFEREEDGSFRYGADFTGRRKLIEDVVRPNSLYLSAGASNNHSLLTRLHRWFRSDLRIATDANHEPRLRETLRLWSDAEERGKVADLLRYADLGIQGIEFVERAPRHVQITQRIAEVLRDLDIPGTVTLDGADWGNDEHEAHLVHQGADGPIALPRYAESSGTRTWTGLIGPVLTTLRSGAVLVIDELDARLHPLLAAQVVSLFQSRTHNPNGAQLLFNTHDATLLAPNSEASLRRDQVWLAEKNERGETELLPLLDYRPRDKVENLEKRYLSGRYGALPFFDERLLDALAG